MHDYEVFIHEDITKLFIEGICVIALACKVELDQNNKVTKHSIWGHNIKPNH